MTIERDVDHSILDRLAALFAAPPSVFENPFNLYYEDSFQNPLFVPTAPFLWVLDKNVRPTQSRLPLLILRRGPTAWLPFEMGNREGQEFVYSITIFGRNRGEPSDLISFLKKHLDPIPLYDYGTDPKTLKYYMHLNAMTSVPSDVAGDVGIEAALANQENLLFSFSIKEL